MQHSFKERNAGMEEDSAGVHDSLCWEQSPSLPASFDLPSNTLGRVRENAKLRRSRSTMEI